MAEVTIIRHCDQIATNNLSPEQDKRKKTPVVARDEKYETRVEELPGEEGPKQGTQKNGGEVASIYLCYLLTDTTRGA